MGIPSSPKGEQEAHPGGIEFGDVSFRYPDGSDDMLSHFYLKIPAGATVAIVGETGTGNGQDSLSLFGGDIGWETKNCR